MDWPIIVWNRLRHLVDRRGLEREIRGELDFHLAMRQERLTPNSAPFGNQSLILEDASAAWRPSLFAHLVRDTRYALRMMRREPLFTASAAILLGAGFILNAVLFKAARQLLFQVPPAISRPEQLLLIGRVEQGRGFDTLSYADFLALGSRTSLFRSVAAYSETPVHLRTPSGTHRVASLAVSREYFQTLGVPLSIGGDWSALSDSTHAVVLSRDCSDRFGATPGARVTVNGTPAELTGVALDGFTGLDPTRPVCAWISFGARATEPANVRWLSLIARRAEGVKANLPIVPYEADFTVTTDPHITLHPGERADIERTAALLLALALVVLAVGASNLSNMLLARANKRGPEMAIRASLGASRTVLAGQIVVECFLLGLLGIAAGLSLSACAAPIIESLLMPPGAAYTLDLTPDVATFAFCFLLLLFLLPVYAAPPAMAAGRRPTARVRPLLIVTQIALSCALLIVAAMLTRHLSAMRAADIGLQYRGLASITLDLALNGYSSGAGRAFYRRLLERAALLPYVDSVSIARLAPLDPAAMDLRARAGEHATPFPVRANFVGPEYFRTIGVRIAEGRDVVSGDRLGAPPVVWINEAAARAAFGTRSPLGQKLVLTFETEPREIVGVVAAYAQRGPRELPRPAVFVPLDQRYFPSAAVVVRSSQPRQTLQRLRSEISALDPNLPPASAQTFEDRLDTLLWDSVLLARLTAGFSLLALLLASAGIYGLISFAVTQRTAELGVHGARGVSRTCLRHRWRRAGQAGAGGPRRGSCRRRGFVDRIAGGAAGSRAI